MSPITRQLAEENVYNLTRELVEGPIIHIIIGGVHVYTLVTYGIFQWIGTGHYPTMSEQMLMTNLTVEIHRTETMIHLLKNKIDSECQECPQNND